MALFSATSTLLQKPPDEVTSQDCTFIPTDNPNRTLQGWKGLFLPFSYAHSKNQRLDRIQVSISMMDPLFLVFIPPPTSAPTGTIMRIKSSMQKAQQTVHSEEEPTSLHGCRLLISANRWGERGKMLHIPCLLLTVKIIPAVPSICPFPWVSQMDSDLWCREMLAMLQ